MLAVRAIGVTERSRAILVWAMVALACGGAVAALVLAGVQWPTEEALTKGLVALVIAAASMSSGDAAVVLILVTVPLFDVATLGPERAPFTVAHVAMAGALAGWVLRALPRGRAALPRPTLLLAAAAMPAIAGLVSLVGSLDPRATIGHAGRLVLMFAIAALFAAHARDERSLARVLGWLVAVGSAMALVAVAQYVWPGLPVGRAATQQRLIDVLYRPSAFFVDPNFLGGYLSACIAVALAWLVRSIDGRTVLRWGVALVACLAGLLVTSSRSAFVGVVAAFVVLVWTAPARRRAALIIAVALIVFAAAPFVPRATYVRLAGLLEPASEGSIPTRSLMLRSSVEMLQEYGIGGTGLGMYDRAYVPYRRPGALPRITHPHQVPLALWIETGLAGLVALASVTAGGVVAWRRIARRGYGAAGAGVLAACVALAVESLFQYYLYFEYAWILLGLLSAAASLDRGDVRA